MIKKIQDKGITLVALVITIIILLVLAGISISALTGSGLLEKSKLAKEESENAQRLENSILENYEKKVNEYNYVNSKTENDSILSGIKNLNKSGQYLLVVNGESYNLHLIVYQGNLLLDGREYPELCIYSNLSYIFGTEDDVAKYNSDTGKIEEAKNMVVLKVNGDIIISEGITISPYLGDYGGPKGFFIYANGTFENNGIISNRTGCFAKGQNVYLWKNSESNTYEMILKEGVSGGSGLNASAGLAQKSYYIGNSGNNAKTQLISYENSSSNIRTLGGGRPEVELLQTMEKVFLHQVLIQIHIQQELEEVHPLC